MVRIQGRGVAGTVAAKVKHLFGLCKEFEEKMCKVSAKKASLPCFFCRAAAIFMQKVRDFAPKITKFSHHGGFIFGDSDFFANFAS